MKPLTDRQERFVHEYIIDQNASAAAGRAGYSRNTRGTQAARLMDMPQVRERIVVELAELYAGLKLDAMEVLRAQLRAARFDPAKLFDAAQAPIPLEALDEETRGALTVTYSLRRSGDHVMHVRQTPRHVALAALQKRLDAFAKLQNETFAQSLAQDEREREAARGRGAEDSPRAPVFNLRFDLPAQVAAAPAEAPAAVPVPMAASAAPVAAVAPAVARASTAAPAAAHASTVTPAPATATAPAAATARATVTAQPEARAAAVAAIAPQAAAAQAAATPAPAAAQEAPDPDAPPSPFEPGYDCKKDPNAAYGGRWIAWNKYQRDKKMRELQAAEEAAAAAAGAPPNMRIGPGKRVMPRMEPGYNPPWLRDNRPQFAIGAGEFYFSGEEPD
ncbi:MAG TPA: terminase small subunit [Burkholderiales bacterium]|nr:terminase small subunit [Burkholderiales bacterium]